MIKYENETYLTTAEASKYLGKNLTSFRQFMYRNDIPRRKIGGRLYFPVKKLNGLFARMKDVNHFETSGLSYEDVYTMAQLREIFLTSRQNIYSFIYRHKIKRYKDNTNQTLYDKVQIDAIIKGKEAVDDL